MRYIVEKTGFEPSLILWNQQVTDSTIQQIHQKQQKLNYRVRWRVRSNKVNCGEWVVSSETNLRIRFPGRNHAPDFGLITQRTS